VRCFWLISTLSGNEQKYSSPFDPCSLTSRQKDVGNMPTLNEAGSLTPLWAWEGVTVRVVHGQLASLAVAELGPGIVVPEHRHPNEQMGVVISGSASFVAEGRTIVLTEGGAYRFHAGVPHQVTAGADGAVFVECFAPPRTDWMSLEPAADAGLRWPKPDFR
jgi:quercetin dioxygenase-like cupin family protein